MRKIVKPLFGLLIKLSSFGIAVSLTTLVSAILAVVFGIYYARSIYFPLSENMNITILFSVMTAAFLHAVFFGLFAKIGLSGVPRSVRAVNRYIQIKPELGIPDNLSESEYQKLLRGLIHLPMDNSLLAILWVQVVLASIGVVGFMEGTINSSHIPQIITMDVIFSFIHGGFSLILGEIATGSLRAECKRVMHYKGYTYSDKAYSTVRLKLGMLLVLFIITVYVAANLVYYNRDKIDSIIFFSILAFFIAVFMTYLIFYLIYSSLKDIIKAMDELKDGGDGLLFTKSVDSEFIQVARGVTSAAKTIKDYQQNLEDKITERTRELKASLDRVKNLKGQQDGDYFLTSLLIKPLSGNYANNENVKIDFVIKQKKSFKFKKRENELGGDLCIAHSIRLKNRSYTVFVNADAMGKSMQGAGGSLVLGAVFQSIIERTKLSEKQQDFSPERWLKNAFLELHKTFESFDGSMLISLVIGLADEQNGFVCFINAEHPWTVLYRNKKSQFIEDDLYLRKLGTMGMDNYISVQTFSMLPGDVLLMGSDGRDDLYLGEDKNGNRIINEDETLFLRSVEKADADLQEIVSVLEIFGPITDDLSLLKVEFVKASEKLLKPHPEIPEKLEKIKSTFDKKKTEKTFQELEKLLQEYPNDIYLYNYLGSLYYSLGDYRKALPYLHRLYEDNPGNTKAILAASMCYFKLGEYSTALDIADRLRIRMNVNKDTIIHIANIYSKMGKKEEARKVVNKFLHKGTDEKQIKELKDKIGIGS